MILTGILVTVALLVGIIGGVIFFLERPKRAPTVLAVTPAGATPAAAAPAAATPAPKKPFMTPTRAVAWFIYLLLILCAVYLVYLLASQGQVGHNRAREALFDWTFSVQQWFEQMSLSTFLLIGIVLLILGLSLPKKAKKFIWAGLALFVVIVFASSGIGSWTSRSIDAFDTCVGYGDCSQRAGDYPVVNSGTVEFLAPGGMESFYVVGKIAIRNFEGYCLGISPWNAFDVDATPDNRIIFLEAYSKETVLATVTSKPAWEC